MSGMPNKQVLDDSGGRNFQDFCQAGVKALIAAVDGLNQEENL